MDGFKKGGKEIMWEKIKKFMNAHAVELELCGLIVVLLLADGLVIGASFAQSAVSGRIALAFMLFFTGFFTSIIIWCLVRNLNFAKREFPKMQSEKDRSVSELRNLQKDYKRLAKMFDESKEKYESCIEALTEENRILKEKKKGGK